jgi:hypothetical protein
MGDNSDRSPQFQFWLTTFSLEPNLAKQCRNNILVQLSSGTTLHFDPLSQTYFLPKYQRLRQPGIKLL